MGNRSFLYISNPKNVKQQTEIAEANNLFPSLWQVLLAHGASSEPIDDQRVFGDAGTDNLASDTQSALGRYKKLAAFIKQHPHFQQVTGLSIHLDSVEQYLSKHVQTLTKQYKTALVFSANLDELSWLDSEEPNAFIENPLQQCNQLWADLEDLMRNNNADLLAEKLNFKDWNISDTDWRAWSIVFGLCLFEDPYFNNAEQAPRNQTYQEYDAEEDANNYDNYLHDGYYKIKRNGLWGVIDKNNQFIIEPKYQSIRLADEDFALHPNVYLWVKQVDFYELVCLDEKRQLQTYLPQQLEEVYNFDGHIAVVKQHGKMGYLHCNGQWHILPQWDEAWDFNNGYAQVCNQGKFGFINQQGQVVVDIKYDETFDMSKNGIARVCLNQRVRLVRANGTLVLSECDSIEWSDDFPGYLAVKNGKKALFLCDGRQVGDWSWDNIAPLIANQFVAIKQNKHIGILNWQGQIVIAPQFAAISAFEPQQGAKKITVENKVQFRVLNVDANQTPSLWGVWDINKNALIIPHLYSSIWLVMLSVQGRYGFYVSHKQAKSYVQLLKDNGQAMFEEQFAWIGKQLPLEKPASLQTLRSLLYTQWATGKPIKAKLLTGKTVELFNNGNLQNV
jgi:uncharacterized protein